MKFYIALAAAIFCLTVEPSAACTLMLQTPEQEKMSRDAFIKWAATVTAIPEVKVIKSSDERSLATVKVIRVIRGNVKVGQKLQLRTEHGAMCGAGHLRKGQRGIIIYDTDRIPYFGGFLDTGTLAEIMAAATMRSNQPTGS